MGITAPSRRKSALAYFCPCLLTYVLACLRISRLGLAHPNPNPSLTLALTLALTLTPDLISGMGGGRCGAEICAQSKEL